jgi:hypothetical protein
MTRTALFAASLLVTPLVAQEPARTPAAQAAPSAPAAQAAPSAPAAQATPTPNVPFAQRLKDERAEVSKLLEALQPKEALARAQALLPATLPTWNNADANGQWNSYLTFKDLATAHYVAYQAAQASGDWEKALTYIKQAQALSQENAKSGAEAFTKISTAHANQAQRSRDTLKENDAYIKTIEAKATKDAGDLQQLELVEKEKKAILESEKWSKQFLLYADTAKKEGDRFDAYVKAMEERIKAEETQIAEYKAGKGDKGKWVDAIVSNPAYLMKSFPEKRVRFEFLCRLAVLDPENAKVTHALDVELGKAPAPKTKAAPKKAKKD